MTKWEYVRLSAYLAGGRPHGCVFRLSPKRDSYTGILRSIGLQVLAQEPEIGVAVPSFAHGTFTSSSYEEGPEKYFELINALTADGWEPFSVDEDGRTRVMHFRRQTA